MPGRVRLAERTEVILDWALDPSGLRLIVDWVAVTLVVLIHFLVWRWRGGGDVLGWSKPAERDSFYSAADTVVGIIVGFTIAALAFFYTIEPGRRMNYVQRIGAGLLRRAWLSAITVPLLAVLILTLGLVVDNPDTHDAAIRWFAEWAIFMVVMRFARLMWLFSRLLRVAADDKEDRADRSNVQVLGPRTRSVN